MDRLLSFVNREQNTTALKAAVNPPPPRLPSPAKSLKKVNVDLEEIIRSKAKFDLSRRTISRSLEKPVLSEKSSKEDQTNKPVFSSQPSTVSKPTPPPKTEPKVEMKKISDLFEDEIGGPMDIFSKAQEDKINTLIADKNRLEEELRQKLEEIKEKEEAVDLYKRLSHVEILSHANGVFECSITSQGGAKRVRISLEPGTEKTQVNVLDSDLDREAEFSPQSSIRFRTSQLHEFYCHLFVKLNPHVFPPS